MRCTLPIRLALVVALLTLPVAGRAATLIAHWSFDGCALTDDSGGGHDLSVAGSPTCDTDGRFGDCPVLNGTDDAFFWDTGGDFAPGNRSWSVAAWIRTTNAAATQSVVSWYRCGADPLCNTGDGALYSIRVAGGHPEWNVRDDVLIDSVVTSTTDVADGQWHLLIGVLDQQASQIRLYVDGALDAAKAMDATGLSFGDVSVPLSIGRFFRRGWGVPGEYVDGSVDEVRVFDGALSDADAQSLFTSNGITPVTPTTWGEIKALFR